MTNSLIFTVQAPRAIAFTCIPGGLLRQICNNLEARGVVSVRVAPKVWLGWSGYEKILRDHGTQQILRNIQDTEIF